MAREVGIRDNKMGAHEWDISRTRGTQRGARGGRGNIRRDEEETQGDDRGGKIGEQRSQQGDNRGTKGDNREKKERQ